METHPDYAKVAKLASSMLRVGLADYVDLGGDPKALDFLGALSLAIDAANFQLHPWPAARDSVVMMLKAFTRAEVGKWLDAHGKL